MDCRTPKIRGVAAAPKFRCAAKTTNLVGFFSVFFSFVTFMGKCFAWSRGHLPPGENVSVCLFFSGSEPPVAATVTIDTDNAAGTRSHLIPSHGIASHPGDPFRRRAVKLSVGGTSISMSASSQLQLQFHSSIALEFSGAGAAKD